MTFGVLYVAFGGWYQQEAIRSHRSLKFHNPDIKTAIVLEQGLIGDVFNEFDHVISIKRGPYHEYTEKVRGLALTPFITTLFLDTDTHVRGPISHMPTLLGDDVIAACPAGEGASYLNSGVVLYRRCEEGSNFLSYWLSRTASANQKELGYTPGRSYSDQDFFNEMRREGWPIKEMDYKVYNCKDEDIWSAIERGEIGTSRILHTHDWQKLYAALPDTDDRLLEKVRDITDFISTVNRQANDMVEARDKYGAVFHLRRAVQYLPYVHLMIPLGHRLWAVGERDEARYWFEMATRAEPKMGYSWANWANVLHGDGRIEDAMAAGQRARSLDPQCRLSFDLDRDSGQSLRQLDGIQAGI